MPDADMSCTHVHSVRGTLSCSTSTRTPLLPPSLTHPLNRSYSLLLRRLEQHQHIPEVLPSHQARDERHGDVEGEDHKDGNGVGDHPLVRALPAGQVQVVPPQLVAVVRALDAPEAGACRRSWNGMKLS